jgi:toxin HigB-1
MGWTVIESRLIARQLPRMPKKLQAKYAVWRSLVQRNGPYLQGGFRVHSLHGKRKGQKSARLNRQWRVIFRIVDADLVVEAVELTPHKY